ncbi:copper amine oxidase N-terminal domain-containing protein [Paenibacillus gallinarum]|uniref:Copper amine oxidase N-terminal domain-containing protein n=1 Tax=Paenibacillus gallinarum TaxID=2762232 RepID=A0ABR8SZB0_9BACL|nr:copper amine oxidase N-terminal domain-containing protein [Paenibacillus gallinarum]MBD7968414.1 copper amine oxidase N-terminal domain-containing protein [Paenibacillus gallinarum]
MSILKKRIMNVVLLFTSMLMAGISFSHVNVADAKSSKVYVQAGVETAEQYSKLEDPIIIQQGRILLPIREISNYLSLNVSWNQKTKSATLYGVNKEIKLTLGSKTAYVDKKKVLLDVPLQMEKGKIYVPLQFVASSVKQKVTWDRTLKTILIPRTYAKGTADQMTYWIKLTTGELFQAKTNQIGTKIGQVSKRFKTMREFEVEKIAAGTYYLRMEESFGMAGTSRNTGQVLVKNGKVLDEDSFSFQGYYEDTTLHKSHGNVLLTNGKQARFLDKNGKVVALYNLTDIMQKDEIYMVEHYNQRMLILREYSSQHLIVYNVQSDNAAYVHELITLPESEREYLEQAGFDRNNEMVRDHIIFFDSIIDGVMTFHYKNKSNNMVNTYTLDLSQI